MPPTIADPTTADWVAAAVAAGLVVVLAALHLLRPVLGRSSASRWGRVGGFLLGALTSGLVLCVAVLVVAGLQADNAPSGPFVPVLVHPEPPTAERLAGYAAAIFLPLAAVLAVLAVAVVDLGRDTGLRIAAAVAAGVILASGVLIAVGEVGAAATGAAWIAAVLAAAAAAAFVVDEIEARQSASSPRSD